MAKTIEPMSARRAPSQSYTTPDSHSVRSVSLFNDLGDEIIEHLRLKMRVRIAQAWERIIVQGCRDDGSVFFILSGCAYARIEVQDRRNTCLVELRRGDVFGELAALEGRSRSATVETTTVCRLAVMDRATFVQAATSLPEFGLAVMRLLSKRLREQNQRLADRCHLDLRQRLIRELLKHAQEEEGCVVIDAPTQANLADMIHARRESVVRELGRLVREGFLRRDNGCFTAIDPQALREIAHQRP